MPNSNQDVPSPLIGLLGAVLSGHPEVQNHLENTGQSMDDVLGALAGQSVNSQAGSGDALAGLLGGLMGGGVSTPGTQGGSPGSSDALGGILGGLLGGSQVQPATGGSADPMTNILGALLGDGGMGSSGLGGSALGSNAFLTPIVDSIASKIGIDPKIAEVVVSFALTKLLAAQSSAKGSDLSGLMERMGSGKPIDQKTLNSTGLVGELASQSGLDNKTASKSLIQVLNTFAKEMA